MNKWWYIHTVEYYSAIKSNKLLVTVVTWVIFKNTATAAKSPQSCLTLCDPIDSSHQAPPSLGFSRQEHWSGLPFPSSMHESEKWKWSRSVVSSSSRLRGLQPTRLLCPWDFPGESTGVGCHCLLSPNLYWQQITGQIGARTIYVWWGESWLQKGHSLKELFFGFIEIYFM